MTGARGVLRRDRIADELGEVGGLAAYGELPRPEARHVEQIVNEQPQAVAPLQDRAGVPFGPCRVQFATLLGADELLGGRANAGQGVAQLVGGD